MKAKIIEFKSKNLNADQLTIEECRKMFNAEEYGYTDEELIQMRDLLIKLAKIYYDFYMKNLRFSTKVIPFNNLPYGEESNHLCTSKHRRAS